MRYNRIRDALLMALIAACVFAIIGAQIYIGIHGSENTQDAVLYTCKESLSFTGVFVRDETVIYSTFKGSGIMHYTVSDGSRLSKNSSVAMIYDSYTQIYNRYRIERLSRELDNLERANDRGVTDYAQPEFINAQIADSYKNLLLNLNKGELGIVYDNSLDLLKLMNIYNVATNVESDFEPRIEKLSGELKNLSAALKEPEYAVTSANTGYFTSHVDGYETELSTAGIDSMTVEQIKNIIANPDKTNESQAGAIGKVFSDYSWKMVGVIDVANRYFVNETLQFSVDSSEAVHTVRVDSITPTGNGNEAIIVISCDELDSELASTRVADVELTFVEATGIRAPRSAIRFKDIKFKVNENGEYEEVKENAEEDENAVYEMVSVKGVYVMVGEQLEFKRLDVIYEGDDYVLSKNTSDSRYLNLYDRIVIDPISNQS